MNPNRSRYYTYIRPIIRSKFAKTYSSLIFSLITISIFSYYAIRPTVTTILSLQKSIQEQNQVLDTLKEKVNNLVSGKRNYENISPPVKAKLESLIPANPSLPQLINSLSYAADNVEASISGLQLQPIVLEKENNQLSKAAAIQEVLFTFNVQGEFPKLMEVLTTLRRLDRLITVSSVNYAKPVDGPILMTVAGKAYYLKTRKD